MGCDLAIMELFPNFKPHVFMKASEIVFALQLCFPPIVLYHPGEKPGLCPLLWAQEHELQVICLSPHHGQQGPMALVFTPTLLSGPWEGRQPTWGAETTFISCNGTLFIFFCEI